MRYLLGIAVLVFTFWNIHHLPIQEFDEARNGVNAAEMLQNGKWGVLHYEDKVDTWNNKPPLFIWLVSACYELFGQSPFALRLPSALATLLSFFFFYKTVRLYQSESIALLACFLLIPIKGFIGIHTGLTGDFDALLICCLLIGNFHFLRYFDFGSKKSVYWTALFLGLAFLTKGPAAFVLLPGWVMYVLYFKKWRALLNMRVAIAGLLFLLFPITWIGLMVYYHPSIDGNSLENLQQILINDLFQRFANPEFEAPKDPSRFTFFFVCLDSYFNVWNYVFYAVLIYFGYRLTQLREGFYAASQRYPFLALSVCLWFSLGLFLSLAATTHRWYLSPVLPFIAYTLAIGIHRAIRGWQPSLYLFIGLFVFTAARRLIEVQQVEEHPAYYNELETIPHLQIIGALPFQKDVLYLHFLAERVDYIDANELDNNATIFVRNYFYQENKTLFANRTIYKKYGNYIFLK